MSSEVPLVREIRNDVPVLITSEASVRMRDPCDTAPPSRGGNAGRRGFRRGTRGGHVLERHRTSGPLPASGPANRPSHRVWWRGTCLPDGALPLHVRGRATSGAAGGSPVRTRRIPTRPPPPRRGP